MDEGRDVLDDAAIGVEAGVAPLPVPGKFKASSPALLNRAVPSLAPLLTARALAMASLLIPG
tara:strand:+ start:774 stop:959 length:186 start_codon:yes stop_codon:yes gene_type:complete